jgi:hypothetical protein
VRLCQLLEHTHKVASKYDPYWTQKALSRSVALVNTRLTVFDGAHDIAHAVVAVGLLDAAMLPRCGR